VLSGVPSTVWAVLRRQDPLAATRAAGRLLLPDGTDPVALVASAAAAHGALSLGWTAVLSRLPGGPVRSVCYGAAIAALDLGLAHAVRGARLGPTADLPVLPQLADHVAFAVIARAAVSAASGSRARSRPPARCA
jgi:hypothetical protein